MSDSRRLYVLGTDRETTEVLQAILSREGTEVKSVHSWEQIDHATPRSPETQEVVVMNATRSVPVPATHADETSLPRVLIGHAPEASSPQDAPVRCLDELFEYPDLMQAIDSLWNRAA